MNILIAEDELEIRNGLKTFFEEQSYNVFSVGDGNKALEIFYNEEIDLALLDINMPLVNGIEVSKKIRGTSQIPILILTAYNDEEYKIKAYDSLVDGYIEKPFSLRLLKSRVDSLIKRHKNMDDIFLYKDAEINFKSYEARYKSKEVILNAKELEILEFLYNNKNVVLTRAQIIDNVWKDYEQIPYDRVIDVYIKELRKKLKLDCIVTIRNVGYKLELK